MTTISNALRPSRAWSVLRQLMQTEAAGGIVLIAAAALALIVANSGLAGFYDALLHTYVGPLSLLHWINDGLMAVFFLFVGLELKRELIDGALSTWERRLLPGAAALGGMVVPAIFFLAVTMGDPSFVRGWAIPAATDIAFALGILALLGSHVPASLKVLLTAIAVIDDLGAILIIAFFYTASLALVSLVCAAGAALTLFTLNRSGVRALWPYLLAGTALWICVYLSGIHATLAGVLTAAFVPLEATPGKPDSPASPLHRLEHGLSPIVAFCILPIFGFANAGVSFADIGWDVLSSPLPLGISLGLILGKQLGVFGACAALIRTGAVDLPQGANWRQLYGMAMVWGVGFTMSLFIGGLAFDEQSGLTAAVKIGVLAGSVISALLAIALVRAPASLPPWLRSRARL